ncbi:MAG: hypothetical protein RBR68_15350 [Tenuifilaceae bacterium]|nr:hypothetical protein [Tenuifilaceae bacterium]
MSGFKGVNYFANYEKAPQIIQGTPNYNVEVSEGNNPPGDFFPATYLKVAVSENRIGGSNFVLMPGKPVAFDTNKRLIPAGLAMEKESFEETYSTTVGDAATKLTAAEAAATIKYSAVDASAGVRDPYTGLVVTADDVVASSMKAAGLGVTDPIGIMRYSALQAAGTDPSDPSTFYKHNYDTGGAKAFTRWAYIQVPVVEINQRAEAMVNGSNSHRIALYLADGGSVTFYKAGVQKTVTQKASPALFTDPVSAGIPDQYAINGRTVFLNCKIAASDWEIRYTPKVDLPFTCLSVGYGSGKIINSTDGSNGLVEKGLADYIGQVVGYNLDSNFQVLGTDGCSTRKLGRILDVKAGSSKDLALVRTYFRDFGLWQEGPGSATDGRNAYLAIANAPKYMVRIAVNFNLFY